MKITPVYYNNKKLIAFSFSLAMIISLNFLIPVNSIAKVTGVCSNCHTMHNSQDGTSMIRGYEAGSGPYESLLRVNDCLGCHGASDRSTAIDSFTGAPIVLNAATDGPSYGASYAGINQGLAGGNFYWVWNGDDSKGHNVFSDNPDETLISGAPGYSGFGGSCGTNSCHTNLHGVCSDTYPGFEGRQGCTKCHMVDAVNGPKGFHHADDSAIVINDYPWYRFLKGHSDADSHGVSGIEDSSWQLNPSSTIHNEYLGKYEIGGNDASFWSLLNHTVSSFCCACHGDFHVQEPSGIWVRHPSDAVIPDSGEYAAYTTYNPEAPVARPSLSGWTGPRDTITRGDGGDMVMCLSCHRPHGSPYPDMLRWNYDDMDAGGGGSGGCFVCHTYKNQIP